MKPLPVTVIVLAAAPAVALVGETEETPGAGFEVDDGGFCVVDVVDEELPPPPQAVNAQVTAIDNTNAERHRVLPELNRYMLRASLK